MTSSIDINYISRNVSYKSLKEKIIIKVYSIVQRKLDSIVRENCKKLDAFNLTMIGVLEEVKTVKKEEAERILKNTKIATKEMIKKDNLLRKGDYLGSKVLKRKYKNALKSMYKLESRLHIIIYNDIKTVPIDKELVEGVRKMNSQNIDRLLG